MKKSNRTVRKMRSAWTGFAAACLAAGEGRECAAELREMLDSPMQWPAVSRWLVMRSPWLADLLHVPANAELDSDAGRSPSTWA